MKWCDIKNEYMVYLRAFENRVPYNDYGSGAYKPFFAPLMEVGDLVYVTQISSKKTRHLKLKESYDFKKIYDDNGMLLSVINLNYMFPVPKKEITFVENYSMINSLRKFNTEEEKSKYIKLLKKELKKIKEKNIEEDVKLIYKEKQNNPEWFVSKRCLDFKKLEEHAKKYVEKKDC